jgi:ActR/RegA family two-component response regulator
LRAIVVARGSLLLVHQDALWLDLLVRVFDGRGFATQTASSVAAAQAALLDGLPTPVDVVVASWDGHHVVGGAVYRWALVHRFDLRDRFVFLADEVTADFDAVVGGRCLLVPTSALAELIQIVEATARRLRGPAAAGGAFVVPGHGPRVLVVDDDPVLLAAIVDVLTTRGYAVTGAAGVAAGDVIARETFDAIVIDIAVAGGVAQLVGRAGRAATSLIERVILVANGPPPIIDRPFGRPVFSKGDDAGLLLGALARIAPRR